MGKFTIILITILLSFALASEDKDWSKKCHALVLEGGGDMGSYQVGVLKAFVDNLPASEVKWDVVTGVSVGSINAAAIGLHAIGQEKEAIDWMVNLWGQFGASDIYKNWRFGILEGLLFEEGLWDNTPEAEYLQKQFETFKDKSLKRRININTVDFDTGEIYKYNEDTTFDVLPQAIRASTSMPFAFPHTYLDGHVFVDGGSVWNVDISGAIDRCREVVSDDKNIIVDIVLCNGVQNLTEADHKEYNTIHNFGRYQQIRSYYSIISDYCEIKRGYPDINFRYVLAPEQELPSGFLPLGFDHEAMLEMIQIGITEGEKAIHGNRNLFDEFISKNQEFCPDHF
jgi:predicted acylesterase/phospholipase RssA